MRYVSTRGDKKDSIDFVQALLSTTASDGGLYYPLFFPQIDWERIRNFNYYQLSAYILSLYSDYEFDDPSVLELTRSAYQNFEHTAVAPLRQLRGGRNVWLLELIYGPTLSFKDYALQLLGKLVNDQLRKQNKKALILTATSGDTGSAAIAAFRGLDRVKIAVLHPDEKIAEYQRKQMTTAMDDNVHNLAIKDGSFDDCQSLIKSKLLEQ